MDFTYERVRNLFINKLLTTNVSEAVPTGGDIKYLSDYFFKASLEEVIAEESFNSRPTVVFPNQDLSEINMSLLGEVL